MAGKKRLTTREYMRAIIKVGIASFKLSPASAISRLMDSLITAALPIATTYYAALTTTALTQAYGGDDGAADSVLVYVLVTAGLGLATLLWGSINQYIAQKTRYAVESAVEDRMLEQFVSLPYELYDDKDTMDLHEKARRFSRFFSYIFDTIGGMLSSAFTAVGTIVALLYVNVWLAPIVLIAIIPNLVIQVRLARRQAHHWELNITNRRKMNNISWQVQQPQNIAEMRVYGIARYLIQYHKKLRDQDEKIRVQYESSTIWKSLLAKAGESLVELGALLWITMQIINREQPVGQFLYVQQMVSRAMGAASSLASQLASTDEDLANIADYQTFMELATTKNTGKPMEEEPKSLRIEDVSFTYPKTDKQVLRGINMTIKKGQHIAIVGENGAGKSTLIKLIMGLYRPTTGAILVDDVDLSKFDTDTWHKQIALLSQDFVLYYHATIEENIQLGDVTKSRSNKNLVKAMDNAEFTEVANPLDHGVNTYIERWMADDDDETTATELSGGQNQRLALARNFYRDAPLVILDEPTSAIDALAEAKIFKRLFSMDKTIVTISHRLSTIKKADVVYMLHGGRIVEVGTAEELIKKQGHFYTMFESQIK